MKVLFYSFFPGGGIGRYTHCLLTSLRKLEGIDVELACSPDFVHLDEAEYPAWPGLMALSSKNVAIRKARFLTAQWVNPIRLVKRAVKTNADIVHFSNINHLSYKFWRGLRRRSGARMTASVHDVRRLKPIVSRAWEDRWLIQFYRDCEGLFVHSQAQKHEVVSFAGVPEDRVHLVPHGIYEYDAPTQGRADLRKENGIPEDKAVGLFFGFIRDDKQLEILLEAVQASQSRPFLVIAGQLSSRSSVTEATYRATISALGLTDDVLFLPGFVSDASVGELFTLADFVCLPYTPSFSSQSGVLHVAVHFRCPVLTTPTPTVAETVSVNELGVVTNGFEINDIAAGIDFLSRRSREDFLEAHSQYARRTAWGINAEATVRVYETLAGDEATFAPYSKTPA